MRLPAYAKKDPAAVFSRFIHAMPCPRGDKCIIAFWLKIPMEHVEQTDLETKKTDRLAMASPVQDNPDGN